MYMCERERVEMDKNKQTQTDGQADRRRHAEEDLSERERDC